MVTYKTIEGYGHYRFGDDGSVWRYYPGSDGRKLRPGRWKRLRPSAKQTVMLTDDEGKARTLSVARLILRAFVGPPPWGCHAYRFPDPAAANNRLDNLRWARPGASKVGDPRMSEASRRKRVVNRAFDDGEVAAILGQSIAGVTAAELAEQWGVHRRCIDNILSGRSYKHIPRPEGLPSGRRDLKGADHPHAMIDPPTVRLIRRLKAEGASGRRIAAQIRVSYGTVRRVLDGSAWTHVD